jgi:hypothetical protein
MKMASLCCFGVAVLAATLTGVSSAQSETNGTAVCPVQMTAAKINSSDSKLLFTYENSSGRYISKIAFGAAYLDPTNQQHPVVVYGGWKDLHAGLKLESALDIKHWHNTDYTGWVVWPEKILYRDGTTWGNSGTEQCGMQAWKSGSASATSVPGAD